MEPNIKIIDDLIDDLNGKDHEIIDIHVGYSWISVLSRNCGISKNFGSLHHYRIKDIGRLKEKTAIDLAVYAKSWNMIEAGIGIAAINSLIDVKGTKGINLLDLLIKKGSGKKIAMIGHFPRIDELKQIADELWVMEKNPQEGDLPDTASEYLVPKADIVVITSSAIINKSIERLLELSNGYTILLGPSTPMSPILFDYGVNLLAGVKVTDEKLMMEKIAQGCGMVRQFEDSIEFMLMER